MGCQAPGRLVRPADAGGAGGHCPGRKAQEFVDVHAYVYIYTYTNDFLIRIWAIGNGEGMELLHDLAFRPALSGSCVDCLEMMTPQQHILSQRPWPSSAQPPLPSPARCGWLGFCDSKRGFI